jgi:hypothetical protein
LYRGLPVRIEDVQPGDGKEEILRVLIKELPIDSPQPDKFGRIKIMPEEDPKRKYISSKHFDIAPFRMGYVNRPDKSGAFYCSRLPSRVQKQGLCGENFKAIDNFGVGVPFAQFLSCKEVLAMVTGDYPSFTQALELVAKVPSVAFHRDYALVRDEVIPKLFYVYYKGAKVGMFNKDEVYLGDKFSCLKESLMEMRLKVGVC